MTSIDKILREKRGRSIASILKNNNFTQEELEFYRTVNELATPELLMQKKKIQEDIDFNQFSAKQIVEESGTEFPPNPVTGQKFRKDGVLYVYQRYGYSFDGDDYIDCGNDASLNITDAITVEAWVKLNGWTGSYQMFVGKKHDEVWSIGVANQGPFRWYITVGGIYHGISSAVFPDLDKWYYLVMTYDKGTGAFKTYVDSKLDRSYTYSGDIATNNKIVSIGADYQGAWFLVNGTTAEVRIYNRALSPAEVREHYLGIFSDETGLVGNWNSSGVTPGQWIDSSGYGNHGTVYGATPCKITLPKRK